MKMYLPIDVPVGQTHNPPDNVEIGTATIPNFACTQGMNTFQGAVQVKLVQSGNVSKVNYDAVAKAFGAFASQETSLGLVNCKGPTSSTVGAEFFVNVMANEFSLDGAPTEMFAAASMDTHTVVHGYNPNTGGKCFIDSTTNPKGLDTDHCMRGSTITGTSVFKKGLQFKDISFDTWFVNPIPAYEVAISFYGNI